jgi:hypothetical protein
VWRGEPFDGRASPRRAEIRWLERRIPRGSGVFCLLRTDVIAFSLVFSCDFFFSGGELAMAVNVGSRSGWISR